MTGLATVTLNDIFFALLNILGQFPVRLGCQTGQHYLFCFLSVNCHSIILCLVSKKVCTRLKFNIVYVLRYKEQLM